MTNSVNLSTIIPRVSIGLAVYNGENFLVEALESLVNQTYRDFELIISDNASTDETENICQKYASEDYRIRYIRQPENRGPAWNQSEVIRLARGEFFRLASHDDVCKPELIGRCVEALDAHPECVMAYPDTYTLPRGDTSFRLHIPDRDTIDTTLSEPSERFSGLIRGDQYGYRIFGLYRTAVIKQTRLFGAFHAADHILLAELGLLGPFYHVKERLFMYRLHDNQSIELSFEPAKYAEWWGAKSSRTGLVFPTWRYVREMIAAIFYIPLPIGQRLRCIGHTCLWCRTKWRLLATEIFKLRPQTPVWDKPR